MPELSEPTPFNSEGAADLFRAPHPVSKVEPKTAYSRNPFSPFVFYNLILSVITQSLWVET